ncbi:flagellar motor switch protein FliN [Balnearium lithotrophicum]|uniref:flagellar motor switch protein FliN n=1 Tax=Balnearium lithotrophicum TaxID=223788 RepID=UPI00115DD8B7|nr:flagellar motor switch protein FliN [Balnearium lithotrophicum]
MAEEEKNLEETAEQKGKTQEEKPKAEGEEVNQENLAKEWEESLKQQQASNSYNQEEQNQEELAKQWEEALKEQELKSTPEETKPSEKCEKEFELLKDIPLEVSVEVGSTKLPLEEILKLHTNSVVELDRFIDEPVDIKINGKLVAKGKLYQVEDNFGVEIVQIITPEERLKLIEE